MSDKLIKETKEQMKKATQAFSKQLATVRAGRANPSILDPVYVDYYGASTPLQQLAQVSAPEPRLLVITPYDKSAISEVEKAIQKADLGLSPSSDGNVVRINIPALTQERRKDLTKLVKKYTEEAKVQIRNIRRETNDTLKKNEKDGDLTEDDLRSYQEDVQKLTDEYVKEIDNLSKQKEEEMLEV
ncbi:ribosome recycling factor [Salimicrobium jeotgali]|uniref:ribosome recycling factor n=1 Tax=Salimicrobium jeotgali TaxID=1230341 RepID=UPI000C8486A9|nr:ribosome recycling factor [Salimicrobium jeotgali]